MITASLNDDDDDDKQTFSWFIPLQSQLSLVLFTLHNTQILRVQISTDLQNVCLSRILPSSFTYAQRSRQSKYLQTDRGNRQTTREIHVNCQLYNCFQGVRAKQDLFLTNMLCNSAGHVMFVQLFFPYQYKPQEKLTG